MIEKGSILALRCGKLLLTATRGSRSEEQCSAIRSERKFNGPERHYSCASWLNLRCSHIIQAAHNPVPLDERQVNAVSARIELDLRLGAIFTRFQTLTLQSLAGDLADRVISYGKPPLNSPRYQPLHLAGSCQFPTLGFVVDRYFRVKNFVPEQFWSIKVTHRREEIDVNFLWRRHRLFDRMAVVILFERCLASRLAKVTKLQKKPTSKWKPLPLTTVELQKLGSRFLRMDSQRVMKVSIPVLRVIL